MQSARSHRLPDDLDRALLIGRVRRPDPVDGPSIIVVRGGELFDITRFAPTTADLFDCRDAVELARTAPGEPLGPVGSLIDTSLTPTRDAGMRLLAPCDVQAIKACGVTFAVSLLERVIEEQAGGDAARALEVRSMISGLLGTDIAKVKPGSEGAVKLKEELQRRNAWSQYMEGESVRMPKYFLNPSRCRRSGWVPMSACIRLQPGTTRSRRSCWQSTRQGRLSARRSATM